MVIREKAASIFACYELESSSVMPIPWDTANQYYCMTLASLLCHMYSAHCFQNVCVIYAKFSRVVCRKLDQDWRSISDQTGPGLRLRNHFISKRWIGSIHITPPMNLQSRIEVILDWCVGTILLSETHSAELMMSSLLLLCSTSCLHGARSRFHVCSYMSVHLLLYLLSFKIEGEH